MSGIRHILACAALAIGCVGALASGTAALAQAAASPHTYATRYDAMGRVTGTIAPDPDGPGPLKHAAARTTFDERGLPTKIETGELASWQSELIEPKNWTDFTVLASTETTYDTYRRKVTELTKGADNVTVGLVQYSYDNRGRLECTAVRMNPAVYGALPASACTLGAQGRHGPDRITRTVYDAAGQVLQVRKGVGTPIEIADVTYSYTLNGKIQQVVDANGNRAELRYDGHDRQTFWVFPDKARPTAFNAATPVTAMASAGALNEGDYEQYWYDPNGNRTRLRKRDGREIAYSYDALNRVTVKDVCAATGAACDSPGPSYLDPAYARDVHYEYDLRGLQTKARFNSLTGPGITYAYDGFGRLTSETQNTDGVSRTVASQYNANGGRTRVTYPDGQYFTYDFDGLDRATVLREGTTELGAATFNNRGLPTQLQWNALAASLNRRSMGYDQAGRLASIGFDLHGTAGDVTWGYTRNPASQIASEIESNSSYAWDGHLNLTRAYTTNGLNQYQSAGVAQFCYDANGNLTADGTSVYRYDVENRLVEKRAQGTGNTNCLTLSYAGSLQAELLYDPTGRLYQVSGGTSGIQRFAYDGNAMIGEYNASGTMLRRYVHGSNAEADDALIWYEGATQTSTLRRYLHSDPRGSIVAVTDHTGNRIATNSYDEYGIPDTATGNDIATKGRFRYTGQAWIPELGMYYYKARIYSPTLGRFLQTDPIGYEDQFNLYAYVGNDPINGFDPTGMNCEGTGGLPSGGRIDGNGTDTYCNLEHPEDDGPEIIVGDVRPSTDPLNIFAATVVSFAPGADAHNCAFVSQCSSTEKALAVADFIPGLGKIDNVGKMGKLARACGCVVAGTLVATPSGLVAIETLEVGDMVLAYDPETDEIVPQPVLDVITTESKPTYNVVLRSTSGETAQFEATDDHPWLNVAKQWRNTEELAVGDRLIAHDGQSFEVTEVGLTGKVEVAYTLTVDHLHTYIMGDAGLVVHNACLKDMRRLSPGQIRELKSRGIDAEALKGDFKMSSREDLYVDKRGDVWVGAKDGSGEATYTGVNIRE